MKNFFTMIIMFILALSMSACYGTSKSKIVGKWNYGDNKTVEFKSNGDIKSDGLFAPMATYTMDGDTMTVSEMISGDLELTVEVQEDGSVKLTGESDGANFAITLKKETDK